MIRHRLSGRHNAWSYDLVIASVLANEPTRNISDTCYTSRKDNLLAILKAGEQCSAKIGALIVQTTENCFGRSAIHFDCFFLLWSIRQNSF